MLIEYYSIRIKDAEPGKGSLHVTPHYDEVRSSLKHFKEKHPDKKVVAYKHELKKGPMGISHKRKEMFGESLDEGLKAGEGKEYEFTYRQGQGRSKYKSVWAGSAKDAIASVKVPANHHIDHLYCVDTDTHHCYKTGRKLSNQFEGLSEMFANRDSGSSDKENKAWEKAFKKRQATNAMPWHKVMATLSNPAHTMVSKRTEQVQRSVKVRANSPEEAKTKAKAFYKKQGYKVHEVDYHSKLNENMGGWNHKGSIVTGNVKVEPGYRDPFERQQDRIRAEIKKRREAEQKNKDNVKPVTEATRSFKTLMRSIEDKKSIKNLKVPSPTERRALEQPKQPEKPSTIKEGNAHVMMGKTVHSVEHGGDTYSIHDMESPRSSSRFKVRRNGKLLANFAAHDSAHAWLKNHIESKKV